MTTFMIDEHERYSLLRVERFAPGHAHAFVVRGRDRRPLFKSEPVPREALCAAAGLDHGTLCLAKQVHGAGVFEVPSSGAPPPTPPPVADGLVSRRAECAVGVATADCLPILVASPSGPCAAIHAGWRGLLAGVIEAGVGALVRSPSAMTEAQSAEEGAELHGPGFQGAAPGPAMGPIAHATLSAAIGPAIGPCCFEVDEEVAARFRARFPGLESVVHPGKRPGKATVDLTAAATAVLHSAGVPAGNTLSTGLCTRCGGDRFESYRRDGSAAGRMIAFIAPR